ncbi:MAG: prenyltransferase/squalene oxidase repeat-containing protein [Caldilineaceae bacterium]
MNTNSELEFVQKVLNFTNLCKLDEKGTYSSVPNGSVTLYGTCYGLLTQSYLKADISIHSETLEFILKCQDMTSGLFIGPELQEWTPLPTATHDRTHLLMHLTCAVLPVLAQYEQKPRFPLFFAHQFCDLTYLTTWLNQRSWRDAWLEGNNLLFVGQLLVFLRDIEENKQAQLALDFYFDWLDSQVDPQTGLWGTNGYCSPFVAMCGGYHQLLVYYYEHRPVLRIEQLIDTVLALQHIDGGFSPKGSGACEDADAVDILVNMYKMSSYRRADIRFALRRTLNHLLSLQNSDGGFPYRKSSAYIHMGIPATASDPGESSIFATWFRVHTIALIAEILTDDPLLRNISFHFNSTLSMGWHPKWDHEQHMLGRNDYLQERLVSTQFLSRWVKNRGYLLGRKVKQMIRR